MQIAWLIMKKYLIYLRYRKSHDKTIHFIIVCFRWKEYIVEIFVNCFLILFL